MELPFLLHLTLFAATDQAFRFVLFTGVWDRAHLVSWNLSLKDWLTRERRISVFFLNLHWSDLPPRGQTRPAFFEFRCDFFKPFELLTLEIFLKLVQMLLAVAYLGQIRKLASFSLWRFWIQIIYSNQIWSIIASSEIVINFLYWPFIIISISEKTQEIFVLWFK